MTAREIEATIENINERVVRATGRELQPLERQQIRRQLIAIFGEPEITSKESANEAR
jgi:hypothetical protein